MSHRSRKDDGLKPGSMKNISKNKLKAFSIGQMNVTTKLSKRAEEEMKKKEQEEEAARLLQDFVADFSTGKSHKGKTFVRGNTINPETKEERTDAKTGRLYQPTSKVAEKVYAKKQEEEDRVLAEARSEAKKEKRRKEKKDSKKSNLELFKEELKLVQAEREERHKLKRTLQGSDMDTSDPASVEPDPFSQEDIRVPVGMEDYTQGSYDYGDPTTTNIFLGSINPKMNEEMLCAEFGKYGPLASVKIMWPRTDEERARNRNCGFVAFMNRKDAERALKALNNKSIMDYEMKLGWGKSVPIPPHPVYIPPAMQELTQPPPPSGLPFNAQLKDKNLYDRLPPGGRPLSHREESILNETLKEAVVKVVIPTDRTLLHLIHRMVEFVIREGPMFEAMIMNQELNNIMFRFLFDNQSPAHVYYRWKLFSLLQGDSTTNWATRDFQMFKFGSYWRPPAVNPYLKGMPENLVPKGGESRSKRSRTPESERRREGLSENQRNKLEDMLRSLNVARFSVGESMVFCLEHADAAEEIVDCITESLSIPETPIPKKIARLYLVSDILYNTSSRVSNASFFRKCFERRLPDIFKYIHDVHISIQQRLKAEQFKQKIMGCFRAWEEWAVYPNDFLVRLQNLFLGLVTYNNDGSVQHKQEEGDDGLPIEGVPLDGLPLDVVSLSLDRPQALDGVPVVKDDLDGMPMGDPDLDGLPITASEDLDGAPVKEEEDDLDGIPLGGGGMLGKRPGFKSAPSKWETVDSSLLEEQAMTSSKWEMLEKDEEPEEEEPEEEENEEEEGGGDDDDDESSQDEAAHSKESTPKPVEMTEEKRARLREIEVKVMKFQDDIEAGRRNRKSGISLHEQIQKYREKLLQKEKTKEEERQRSKEKEKEREKVRSRMKDYEKARERERERLGDSSADDSEEETTKHKRKHSRSRSRSPRRKGGSGSGSPISDRRSRKGSAEPSPLAAIREYSDSPSSRSRKSRSRTPKRPSHRSRSPRRQSGARSRSRSPVESRKRRSRSRSPSRKKSKKSKH
ncbi:U2 snRNP-associated SURP motif-containing protein-like [Apostichopus japonicus]|uniref:U2 snRNP-associated SURP motif-containing protein-like n=1 Tax=Stichopus japonicus TaxID=307972 RepID=UPI003AB7CF48